MAARVRLTKIDEKATSIAGANVAIAGDALIGGISVLSHPALDLMEYTWGTERIRVRYVPGHLSFREIPVFLRCYRKHKVKPDLILVEGPGIGHSCGDQVRAPDSRGKTRRRHV